MKTHLLFCIENRLQSILFNLENIDSHKFSSFFERKFRHRYDFWIKTQKDNFTDYEIALYILELFHGLSIEYKYQDAYLQQLENKQKKIEEAQFKKEAEELKKFEKIQKKLRKTEYKIFNKDPEKDALFEKFKNNHQIGRIEKKN